MLSHVDRSSLIASYRCSHTSIIFGMKASPNPTGDVFQYTLRLYIFILIHVGVLPFSLAALSWHVVLSPALSCPSVIRNTTRFGFAPEFVLDFFSNRFAPTRKAAGQFVPPCFGYGNINGASDQLMSKTEESLFATFLR